MNIARVALAALGATVAYFVIGGEGASGIAGTKPARDDHTFCE